MDALMQFKENIFKNNIECGILRQEKVSLFPRVWRRQRASLTLIQNVVSITNTDDTFINISRWLR